MIQITYTNDEGDEVTCDLPSKNVVCPRCEGDGTHLTPSIGQHAYSAEEFEEAFSESEDREEYFRRGGRYDVVCERCCGRNVVKVVDVDACRTDEQKAHLAAYEGYEREQYEYEAECRAERRMEAMMLGEYEY